MLYFGIAVVCVIVFNLVTGDRFRSNKSGSGDKAFFSLLGACFTVIIALGVYDVAGGDPHKIPTSALLAGLYFELIFILQLVRVWVIQRMREKTKREQAHLDELSKNPYLHIEKEVRDKLESAHKLQEECGGSSSKGAKLIAKLENQLRQIEELKSRHNEKLAREAEENRIFKIKQMEAEIDHLSNQAEVIELQLRPEKEKIETEEELKKLSEHLGRSNEEVLKN